MEEILIKAGVVCVMAVCFGGFLIWRGVTGEVWRSRFTGDAIVPAWMYVAGGVIAIIGAIGYIAVTLLLART